MISMASYLPVHLEKLIPRDFDWKQKPDGIVGEAYTMLRNDDPIAIFGGFFLAPGVLQVWSLLDDKIRETPIEFHKQAKTLLDSAIQIYRPRRVQISVRCGNATAWKWALSLGFACEGVMKSYYFDGSDCWLFARTT